MKEVLKRTLDALEYWDVHGRLHQPTKEAITAIKAALAQPAQQEPVAWMREDGTLRFAEGKVFAVNQPLYTTPPQRAWVGLTEARAKEIWLKGKDHGDDWLDVLALARAFEAELKELNT
jgi:hypothetical protein